MKMMKVPVPSWIQYDWNGKFFSSFFIPPSIDFLPSLRAFFSCKVLSCIWLSRLAGLIRRREGYLERWLLQSKLRIVL